MCPSDIASSSAVGRDGRDCLLPHQPTTNPDFDSGSQAVFQLRIRTPKRLCALERGELWNCLLLSQAVPSLGFGSTRMHACEVSKDPTLLRAAGSHSHLQTNTASRAFYAGRQINIVFKLRKNVMQGQQQCPYLPSTLYKF